MYLLWSPASSNVVPRSTLNIIYLHVCLFAQKVICVCLCWQKANINFTAAHHWKLKCRRRFMLGLGQGVYTVSVVFALEIYKNL